MAESRKTQQAFNFPILILVATFITGCSGWAMIFTPTARDGQALGLIAAALAFGLLANALWRCCSTVDHLNMVD